MKKIFYLFLILISLSLIFINSSCASENNLAIANNGASSAIAYPSQRDVETLDFTLRPAEDDILDALTIKNSGLAPNAYLEAVTLYADDGDGVFQGWKQDAEIGKGAYYDQNSVWQWTDLNISVPKEGKRFFVAAETKKNGNIINDRRTIQMAISLLTDADSDGVFDYAADTGVFMNSKNNGPASEILNAEAQTIYKKIYDILPPKSVIAYPLAGEKIAEKNIIISGFSRDQGGSTPSSVEINISEKGVENTAWSEVAATESNYGAWRYNWNNILDGIYIIKVRADDWIGNSSEEAGIEVVVDTTPAPSPAPTALPSPSPVVTPAPTLTPTPELSPSPEDRDGAAAENIPDGGLIREKSTLDIYIVKVIGAKKFKRLILNPKIFNSYGYLKWSDVRDISRATLDAYATSDLVIEVNADGSIANPKVYRVSASPDSDVGQKRWLEVSAGQFEAAGLDWDSIFKINHTEASADFYPEKEAITSL